MIDPSGPQLPGGHSDPYLQDRLRTGICAFASEVKRKKPRIAGLVVIKLHQIDEIRLVVLGWWVRQFWRARAYPIYRVSPEGLRLPAGDDAQSSNSVVIFIQNINLAPSKFEENV